MLRQMSGSWILEGPAGAIAVPGHDEIVRRLAMLFEGECEGLGATTAAEKFGFTRQRYYQLLETFRAHGAGALLPAKRGPKTLYRRGGQAQIQIIRHRFLDPDASTAVIAQRLRQCGLPISERSVQRVFEEYGLQKKTLRRGAAAAAAGGHASNPRHRAPRKR